MPSVLVFCLVLVALAWGFIEARRLRVVETDFRSEKIPAAFEGYRLVLIGGLHLRGFDSREKRLQQEIEGLRPDLLLLGGNVKATHRSDNANTHALLKEFVEPLTPPDGILAVRGYRDRKRFWDEPPAESRVELLSNSSKTIEREGATLSVLGIQSAHASHLDRGINQLRETISTLPEETGGRGFRILLGQSADLLRVAQGLPLDLILAVDNLHYQTRVPGWGVPRRDTKVPYRWARGWIREGALRLYLNPGLGTRWHPFRFFYRPEITAVTFRSDANIESSQ